MCLYLRNANNPFSYQTNPDVNALTLVADMVEIVGLNSKPVALETGSVVERLVWESQDEIARSGGFKNLVSGTDTAAYLPFMALPRLSDWVAEDTLSEGQVYLYDTRLDHLSGLNETASLIWLMATEGAGPDDIAATLYESASRQQRQRLPKHFQKSVPSLCCHGQARLRYGHGAPR